MNAKAGQYYYASRANNFRIYFQATEGSVYLLPETYFTKEAAKAEVYRLNGWTKSEAAIVEPTKEEIKNVS